MKHTIKFLLTISFILLLISVSSKAQMWAPSGAKWYYTFDSFGTAGYIKIEYSKDTLIYDNSSPYQFRNCQKLSKTFFSYNHFNGNLDTISLGNEYTWSNDDTVFIYKHNKFYVLYDFSAQPGDTWIIPETYNMWGMCDSVGEIRVVSVGDTILNSKTLRYIITEPQNHSHWVLFGKIIEKIGPLMYMLPEQNCILDYMEGGPLRCYQDNVFQYTTSIAPYCDYITGIKEPDDYSLMIYPNPAIHTLTIKCQPSELYDIEITSIHSTKIREYFNIGNGMTIKLNGIEPGFYILSLRNVRLNIIKTKLQVIL
ncbi:MAG: T9SS type A sorting domain-containing protein [Bacteroidales bacterium]|nr:T9SS type A sorting domain-containing protein [Bacteroidales bacterium]MDZ4203790.1 T9SS type A sorting domain-containing protein [Bacteroidales bacterium]